MRKMTFADETTRGGRSDGWELEITEERLTVRELIRRRVFQKPEDAEVTLPNLVPLVGG
ncbi:MULTISPECIES: hypothetical protein [unclassified Streptomyces]|uniref:hypothetical protein n=1 Tax=unclassified Streptomyces TaxID=2593676 RepID=UPI00364A4E8D